MSYRLDFAADARLEWQALPIDVQELVLDMLDSILDDPPSVDDHIAEAVNDATGFRRTIFIRMLIEHERATISVLGVGMAQRSKL